MIRNLLFDLGNVLLPIQPADTARALEAAMGIPYENLLQQPDEMLVKFETGRINYIVFFNYLSRIAPEIVHINDLLPAWTSMLKPLRQETINDLLTLSNDYKCYLLSNTNEVHIEWFERHLRQQGLYDTWYGRIFTHCYYSHIVGHRKPEPEIFTEVITTAGLRPDETLFVDDLRLNVDAAARLGFHAAHYEIGSEALLTFISNKIEQIK